MKNIGVLLALIFLFIACGQSKKKEKKELEVFCAASLTDVVSEISADFEKETGWKVRLNFASSGTLARQIEHGAEPTVFISANKKWLDYLNDLGLTILETSKKVAANKMVLVAPVSSKIQPFVFSSKIKLPDLFEGRISIGDPQHVPAGAYAVQIFKNLNYEEELKPRFLPAKDVRSALMVVELGEVEAGVVYKTDALKSEKVKILTEFPDSLHNAVNYYMAIVKGSEDENSLQLYNYIVSEKALPVWEKYGFIQ
ncbi:molybdate ABC transporter substrate-binding protein [Maribellus sp. YY47]|uniref:molybdate ABC transporter substrate-binding protein n=1 Tax=Maribellus sp. YY47 TaxID=2929486 RepID=UPI002000EDC8|nr:molybdate ABC transporter substrate-binding protein [Maribellus sp. YY47]MCK3686420.1 molybdate ABC transporter substrate-binding protein [Maribellus sp. YY47]